MYVYIYISRMYIHVCSHAHYVDQSIAGCGRVTVTQLPWWCHRGRCRCDVDGRCRCLAYAWLGHAGPLGLFDENKLSLFESNKQISENGWPWLAWYHQPLDDLAKGKDDEISKIAFTARPKSNSCWGKNLLKIYHEWDCRSPLNGGHGPCCERHVSFLGKKSWNFGGKMSRAECLLANVFNVAVIVASHSAAPIFHHNPLQRISGFMWIPMVSIA